MTISIFLAIAIFTVGMLVGVIALKLELDAYNRKMARLIDEDEVPERG